ncbi:MAG: hypothetical protein AAFY76_14425 [Cyanobacteria bacterium J06649_11]
MAIGLRRHPLGVSQIEKLYIKVLEQYKTHQEKKKFTLILE